MFSRVGWKKLTNTKTTVQFSTSLDALWYLDCDISFFSSFWPWKELANSTLPRFGEIF